MSLEVTAWRLLDTCGRPAFCTVGTAGEYEGAWDLQVFRGGKLFMNEQHAHNDEAFDRALDIWSTLIDQGWMEPDIAD